jgi:hypothetical protein
MQTLECREKAGLSVRGELAITSSGRGHLELLLPRLVLRADVSQEKLLLRHPRIGRMVLPDYVPPRSRL